MGVSRVREAAAPRTQVGHTDGDTVHDEAMMEQKEDTAMEEMEEAAGRRSRLLIGSRDRCNALPMRRL